MGDLNKLKVTIGKYDYVLKSPRTNEEMREIARYVEEKFNEASMGTARYSEAMQAVLAALNITDELFAEREEHEKLKKLAEEPLRTAGPMKQKMEELREKIETLSHEKEELREELEKKAEESEAFRKKIAALEQQLDRQAQSATDKDEDLKVLQEMLEEVEKKQIDTAKQFQEYRRTHK